MMDELKTLPETTPVTPAEIPAPVPIRRRARLAVELTILLVLMGAILALASNKFQFEEVVSASMVPTLQIGDIILTDANAAPRRYDVICLISPEDPAREEKFVKRVMGLPGDVITIQDGILAINGQEEYSKAIPDNKIVWYNSKIKVPEQRLFLLGDNRNNSYDSLNFGPVPYDNITGVVQFIVWPPKRWGRPQKLH